MDAPPQQEPCDAFIAISSMLRAAGLSAPEVLEQDLEQGFLLLNDFGSTDYLSILNGQTEAALYADALDAVLQMQTNIDPACLPPYDEALLNREMDLFYDWFLLRQLNLRLSEAQHNIWSSIKQTLVASALAQPQVFVHRDYHSRNLMKLQTNNPGILDFQDAVKGPISYDLVSLLRDCYISWPTQRVKQLLKGYHEQALVRGLIGVEFEPFLHWFNLMGVQRHLKAIGIFSRLNLRDGKSGFLPDIPRTLNYIQLVSVEEPTMAGLHRLIDELKLEQRARSLT